MTEFAITGQAKAVHDAVGGSAAGCALASSGCSRRSVKLLQDDASFSQWLLFHCCCCQRLVMQILVGNKSDIADEKRAVPYSRGQALANEFGMQFFESSAKDNVNVEEVSNSGQ
jgi:GTPase SAR1 family protein